MRLERANELKKKKKEDVIAKIIKDWDDARRLLENKQKEMKTHKENTFYFYSKLRKLPDDNRNIKN